MKANVQNADDSAVLIETVRSAFSRNFPLRIRGADTKHFLGRPTEGAVLDTRRHSGIVKYDPTELVVTVRSGTTVADLESVLDAADQMLPCEAPTFGGAATVGGMVASGLSGPRRPYGGAVRDFVLGCRIISGEGKHLRFGGEVMKNVAGYDISRLMAGCMGCLGLITEVSLKVQPKPRSALSLVQTKSVESALECIPKWRSEGVPIAGACHVDNTLYVRVEGDEGSVKAAREVVGGEELNTDFWPALREFRLPFFAGDIPLWRLSLPSATPGIALPGPAMLDWGGSQRWLKSDAAPSLIRELAQRHGGHATCFTPKVTDEPFHPLPAPLMSLHQRLKKQMDPHGIFNPGRLYAGL
jgi:glycolate oxidase FAD binding subunit